MTWRKKSLKMIKILGSEERKIGGISPERKNNQKSIVAITRAK